MSGFKTRPSNNFHCFEGVGLPFWRAIATGLSPTGVRRGPMGSSIELADDTDGFVLRNGGIHAPQVTKLPLGRYFRFSGTSANNRFGSAFAMAGGWWIDYENCVKVFEYAERADVSVARAAQRLLAIPNEWHDCGYLGKSVLRFEMKAFVGRGKPAAGGISPDNAARAALGKPVVVSPAHLDMKQFFVPGTRAELGAAFQPLWAKSVIHKQAAIDLHG